MDEPTQLVCCYWRVHVLDCFDATGIFSLSSGMEYASTPLDLLLEENAFLS